MNSEWNVVIKIWTESLLNEEGICDLRKPKVKNMIVDIITLIRDWVGVVLVTSWAVWLWASKIWKDLVVSETVYKKVCAWVWQPELMRKYAEAFESASIPVYQLLCTHSDFHNKARSRSMFEDMEFCMHNSILPIINENDPLTMEELKLVQKQADNDNNAFHVARLVNARALFLITNTNWIFTWDPSNPLSQRIAYLDSIDDTVLNATKGKSNRWTWGMYSKARIAKLASECWITTHILDSETSTILEHLNGTQKWGTVIKACLK